MYIVDVCTFKSNNELMNHLGNEDWREHELHCYKVITDSYVYYGSLNISKCSVI